MAETLRIVEYSNADFFRTYLLFWAHFALCRQNKADKKARVPKLKSVHDLLLSPHFSLGLT